MKASTAESVAPMRPLDTATTPRRKSHGHHGLSLLLIAAFLVPLQPDAKRPTGAPPSSHDMAIAVRTDPASKAAAGGRASSAMAAKGGERAEEASAAPEGPGRRGWSLAEFACSRMQMAPVGIIQTAPAYLSCQR